MTIRPSEIPDAMKRRMSKADRKALGKHGETYEEAEARAVIMTERDLQNKLYALLYRRGHKPRMQRMDRKSNIAIGMPDISFSFYGRSVEWEVKLPGKEPDHEQWKMIFALRSEPNSAEVRVIRSFQEGLDHLNYLQTQRTLTERSAG